ncbi:hypothetical protein ANN_07148 [Periplaneta americana]|uniref:Mutator-like transposase domain-containing protein n=1 Tax=Periplaneta americana TaxID=6978 RepID=A0ABQ8TGE5_PERAM|nr:hypothetical protein ANN_07148 [Periplaneta americana]
MGQGYASLQLFCSSMNMKPMTHKTFDMHLTKIKAVCREVVSNVLSQTRQSVKEAYFEVDPAIANNPTLDITVSYDGTWQKRGHTSNYGVGCVVDVFTGYVIDFEVMSKSCHKCSIYSKKLGAKSKAFKEWHDRHIPDCEYNYTGSSPAMEMEAAKILWERSKSYGLRYTTMLSDGDAKTFSHLQQSKVYGDNVDLVKEECINYIHKRMGTALRNLVSDEKKRSSTIGGRKHGNLTAQKIEKIARYYRNAILQHSGNVPGAAECTGLLILYLNCDRTRALLIRSQIFLILLPLLLLILIHLKLLPNGVAQLTKAFSYRSRVALGHVLDSRLGSLPGWIFPRFFPNQQRHVNNGTKRTAWKIMT